MAKIKVKIAENTRMGTHSFYAVPQWAGTLSTEEILDELKGFRCQLGKEFLTVYPNIQASAKDVKDKTTGEVTPATADMVSLASGKSRLGCTVSKKFSAQFAAAVSWQRVDGAADPTDEDDVTQGNENVEGNTGGGSQQGDDDLEG